jgi:hypothetical protein
MAVSSPLYEHDFHAWTQEQVRLLDKGQFDDLDVNHLIEELHLMAGTERRALGSQLERLLLHCLKWQYQPDKRRTGHSWEHSIVDARERLHDLLDDSGSLTRFVAPLVERHYPRARRKAAHQTGLPPATFPATCPWTIDQLLDEGFWPDAPSA